MSDGAPVPNISRKRGNASVLAGGQVPAKIWGTTISIVKPHKEKAHPQTRTTINIETDDEKGDESERDEAEADSDELEPESTDEDSQKEEELMDEATPRISKVKPHLEPIKQPCILIFDSLAGCQSRAKVVATLREYLAVEWKVRHKGKPKDFSKDVMKGATPKVPQQPNFVDCGLYLLQFVEAFFKNPITDYRMPIKSIRDWFTSDVVSRKRIEISKLLLELMREQNIDIAQLNLPSLELTNPFNDYDEGEEDHEEFDEEHLGEEEEEDGIGEEEEDEDGIDEFNDARSIKSSHSKLQMEHFARLEKIERLPSPRTFDVRPEVTFRPAEVRHEPMRSVELQSPRSRLPDSVTICEANSKRKLPLSLKDIRSPRNPQSLHTIEKVKKPRME